MIKKFEMTVTLDDNGVLNTSTKNDGFNAAELMGILELKKQDVVAQINDKDGIKFKRAVVKDGETMTIEDREADESAKIGRWLKYYDSETIQTHLKCSVCETVQVYPGKHVSHIPECPHCHAAMTETI